MLKYKIIKTLSFLWKIYVIVTLIVGQLFVVIALLGGITLTLGNRVIKWEGVLHYTLLPIIKWLYKY